MTVTAIIRQKQHLADVRFDDGTQVLLDVDILADSDLGMGSEIDPEALSALRFSSDETRAKSYAMWCLDRMDYTEKKLYEKLTAKGYDKKACAAVMARLCELGLVDDDRYARRFAEALMEKNISKREAIQKMMNRGIPYDLCKEVLAEFEPDEEAQIRAVIEKKYTEKLERENGYQLVFAALARKGFSYSAIKAALKKYNEDLEFSEESE